MFWSIFLFGFVLFLGVLRSLRPQVFQVFQCCIEAIVDFIDDLTISIFQHKITNSTASVDYFCLGVFDEFGI